MAGEHDQEVEQLTPEQDAAADAEFEAAFNKARGDEPNAEGSTTPTPAPTEAPGNGEGQGNDQATEAEAAAKAAADAAAEAQAKADAEAAAKAQAEAEANAPVSITKTELAALLASAAKVDQLQDEMKRTRDSTAGHIGSLKQTIEAVKARAEKGQRPTIKQLKRIEAEFPELGAMLKEDLGEAFGTDDAADPATDPAAAAGQEPTAAPTPAPTQAPADPFADPRVVETLRQKEVAVLDASHPDWRNLKATPEFNEWRNSLPPAAQHVLANSWEAKVLNDAFADFKDWMKKRAEQAATTNQRNKRLEHGTPATTGAPTGTNAVDDDAAFLAGFKAARGT